LASGGLDSSIKLWDVSNMKEIAALEENPGWVLCLAFSADGKTLAAGTGDLFKLDVPGKIIFWDMSKRKPRATREGHKDSVTSLAFRKQDQAWASASMDKTVKLWSDASGKELSTLKGHDGPVLSAVFSPDGNVLASASWDKSIKLWNVTSK
jgi:WD40 repeat protein